MATESTNSTIGDQPVAVRVAKPSDAAAIAGIYNQHVALGGATFDILPWTEATVNRLLQRPPPDRWFVADSGASIEGWASVRRFSERFGYRQSCETAIYVDSTAIGSGVADRLQHRIEAHCVATKIHHAVAKIIADNQRSIRFHQRFGYEFVGVQREIGRLRGRWVDIVIMQRLFPVQPCDD